MKKDKLNSKFSKKLLTPIFILIVALCCVCFTFFKSNKFTYAYRTAYSLSLVENGGTYIEEYIEPTYYAIGIETALPTREQITKQGYILAGWTAIDEPFDETTNPYITTISATASGDKTFYAKWVEKTYIYDISISPTSSPTNIHYELYGRTEDPTIRYLMYENISDPSTSSSDIDADRKYNESDYYDCEIHFPEGEDYAHFFMGSFSITNGVYKIYGNTCFSNDSGDGNFYVNGGTLIIAGGKHITGSGCDVTIFATFISGRIEIQNGTIGGNIYTFTNDLEDSLTEIIISNGAKLTDNFDITLDQGVKIIDNGYTANELEENKPKIKIRLVPDNYSDNKWTVGDLIVQKGTSIPQLNNYTLENYYLNDDSNNEFKLGIGENDTIVLTRTYGLILNEASGNYAQGFTKPTNYIYKLGLTLPNSEQIIKDGYVLSGWTANNQQYNQITNPYITTISATDFGEKTFYAQWEPAYTIIWKNGDSILETDIRIKNGATPLYNGTVPTKTSDSANYRYQFIGWSDGNNEYINANLPTVDNNTIYTAIFAKKYINFKTEPTVNNSIDSTIEIPDGIDYDVNLVIKVKDPTEINNNFVMPKGQEIVKSYNAKLFKDEIEYTSYTGIMTIKIATPTELAERKNIQIVVMDKSTGTFVTKNAIIENNYLLFETNSLGDFAIIANKETNLLWLWILLCLIGLSLIVLLLLFIYVYKRKVIFILNNKKVGVAKYKRGDELKFPLNLARYKWFTNKEQTKLLAKQKMGWFSFTVYRTTKKIQNKKS